MPGISPTPPSPRITHTAIVRVLSPSTLNTSFVHSERSDLVVASLLKSSRTFSSNVTAQANGPHRVCPRAASHRKCGCSSPNDCGFLKSSCHQLCSRVNKHHTQPFIRNREVSNPGLSDVQGHYPHIGYVRRPVGYLPGGNHLQVDAGSP